MFHKKRISRVTLLSMTAPHVRTGIVGEAIAVRYLRNLGYTIVVTNWNCHGIGEIDIIAMRSEVLHFVEVKSVTRESGKTDTIQNPLENITTSKLLSLRRCAEVYLSSHQNISRVTFSAVSVVLDPMNHVARCALYDDIPLA